MPGRIKKHQMMNAYGSTGALCMRNNKKMLQANGKTVN